MAECSRKISQISLMASAFYQTKVVYLQNRRIRFPAILPKKSLIYEIGVMSRYQNAHPAGFSDDEDGFSDDFELTYPEPRDTGNSATVYPEDVEEEINEEAEWFKKSFNVEKVNMDMEIPNEDESINQVDDFRNSLVKNYSKRVESLLKKGLSVNQQFFGLEGDTPLSIACNRGYPELISLLLKHGASWDNLSELPPIMSVCTSNEQNEKTLIRCIKILLDHGADVNQRQQQRMTALMFASKFGRAVLCEYLLEQGAEIDAADTQEWTALCFACDNNHGHVARVLLDNGADPDVSTRDGARPAELAAAKGCTKLQEIVEKFSKKRSILTGADFIPPPNISNAPTKELTIQYTELDNVLMGLDLTEYLSKFKAHKMDLEGFLSINEEDLDRLEIKEMGVRKKLLTGISEIHKRDWEKTSLPRITPYDKSRGIYFSCPDAVRMVANIGEHLKFIKSNLKFMEGKIDARPETLQMGQDVANVKSILKYVKTSKIRVKDVAQQLTSFEKLLKKHESKLEFQSAESVGASRRSSSWKKVVLLSAAALILVTVARTKQSY